MVEVRITYETLFDLLRREKSRNELQDLENTFFEDVVTYLRDKNSTLGDQSTSSRAEQEKIKIQIRNIKRILKELYELREKKIINLATNKIRTGSNLIDTSKMLPEERQLYEETCLLLEKFKSGILLKISEMDLPDIELGEYAHKREVVSSDEEDKTDVSEDVNENVSYESTYINNDEKLSNGNSKVRFLSDLPKFMGLDKKPYGPFSKNDTAELPQDMVELLSKKGRIELV